MTKEEAKTETYVKGVVSVIGLFATPLFFLWSSFVLMKLWLWFLVPLGLAPITIAHAFGIGCFATFVSYRNVKREDDVIKIVADQIIVPGWFLCFGYIAHHWFM